MTVISDLVYLGLIDITVFDDGGEWFMSILDVVECIPFYIYLHSSTKVGISALKVC